MSTVGALTELAVGRGGGARRAGSLPLGGRSCHHFHESTSRYDRDQKLLSFLLVCRICGTEKLVHRQPYEPRFKPHPA